MSPGLDIARAVFGVVLSFLLTSCITRGAFEKPTEFPSLQQAVNVNVSTISVARWEDYAAALQAQFTMSPDIAYGDALPQTSISQNSVASAVSLGLQLNAGSPAAGSQGGGSASGSAAGSGGSSGGGSGSGSASSGTSGSGTSGDASGGKGSGSSTTPSTSGSGTPSAASASPTLPSANGIPAPSGTVQNDAILAYTAATAIYQEVQLLNRYIQDAALRYGYVPYVARIQVSVIPYARNEPYDLYLDLGLFSHCYGRTPDDGSPAFVVPLLVTDDIEKGQGTTAENIAQQLALGLAGTAHSFGGSANASAASDQIKSVLASSFNSLFMVSRGPSDNVLQVRIGAASNPVVKTRFAMLAQTHNVTFLLLVKKEDAALETGGCSLPRVPGSDWLQHQSQSDRKQDGPVVNVVSLARLRHVTTGVEIAVEPTAAIKQERKVLDRILESDTRGIVSNDDLATLADAAKAGSDGSFQRFLSAMGHLKLDTGYAEALWTGLADAAAKSEFRGLLFNLPYPSRHTDLRYQTVFVLDNCKDTATTSLMGLGDLAPGQFVAELRLHDDEYHVAATKVLQSASGAPWTLTFPSLHELAREVDEVKTACAAGGDAAAAPLPKRLRSAKLVIYRVLDQRWVNARYAPPSLMESLACDGQCEFEFDTVMFDGTAQSSLTVGLTAGADSITADPTQGTGKTRLILKIDKDLDSVVIAVTGGFVTSLPTVTGTAIVTQTNGGLTVTPATPGAATTVVLDIPLQGLVVGRAVTVTGTGQKNQKPTTSAVPLLVLPIVGASSAAKSTTPSGT